MGVQPVTRPWPMSAPIQSQLIVPGQTGRGGRSPHHHHHHQSQQSGPTLQSYEIYPSNLNMKSCISFYQPHQQRPQTRQNQSTSSSSSSAITNSIYQQQQKQQQFHEYETISQIRNDAKYSTTSTSPQQHYQSQSTSGGSRSCRPKSMIEHDNDFKANYKLITQGMVNGQMSISGPLLPLSGKMCEKQQQQQLSPQPPPPPPLPSLPPVIIQSRNDASLHLHANGRVSTTPSCVPWLKRIKVIKRIKRGIGFGSAKSGTQFNNLPALNFHPVHGENVQIFNGGNVAKRINSFCKAIAFTDRPIKLNEKVCIRLLQVSTNWSGVLRFGLTNQDPSSLKNSLPKYVCPDLTSRPGFWAKAFSDNLVKEGMTINFHVNSSGELIYCIDGEEKGIFLTNVDVRTPLWAIIDVYGNTTAIELVDTRTQLNNSRPPSSSSGSAGCNDSLPSPCSHRFMSTSAMSTPKTSVHHLMNHSYISTKSLPDPPHPPPPSSFQQQSSSPSSSKCLSSMSTSVLKQPLLLPSSSSCQVRNSQQHHHHHHDNTYIHLPVKSTVFQSNSKSLYGTCGSNNSSSNNNNQHRDFNGNPMTNNNNNNGSSPSRLSQHQQLPVYKTPPAPKRVDDYDYIYSTKCGLSTSTPSNPNSSNYVSIPSLNAHKIRECSKLSTPNYSSSSDLKQQQQQSTTTTTPTPTPTNNNNTTTTTSSSGFQLECLACCDLEVNSVFYPCGHVCMCLQCGLYQKAKMGQCPICRANITDVIRTYT